MSHKVYIVDDDSAVRKALALLLRSVEFDVETFVSAQAFLEAYQPAPPGTRCCLVTDLRMPGMSGLELQHELRRLNISIPLIVISAHVDVALAVRAMRAGALSVLEKPLNEQELIDSIHHAVNAITPGERPSQAMVLAEYRERLTQRQCQVFDLLMQGLQTKEVARQLDLSHRTVEVHRAKILERLQVSSFSQLLRQLLVRPDNH